MGGERIRVSVMSIGAKACIEETCCTEGEGTLHMMIGFGFSVVNFAISGAFFVAISFTSLDSQKKVNSEIDFGCRDAVILDGEVTLFMSSASGFQKKDRSVMGFRHGVTGNEMIFVEDENQSDLTC